MKKKSPSMNEWIDCNTYNRLLLRNKKNKLLIHLTKPQRHCSEWKSQSHEAKLNLIPFIWHSEKDKNCSDGEQGWGIVWLQQHRMREFGGNRTFGNPDCDGGYTNLHTVKSTRTPHACACTHMHNQVNYTEC